MKYRGAWLYNLVSKEEALLFDEQRTKNETPYDSTKVFSPYFERGGVLPTGTTFFVHHGEVTNQGDKVSICWCQEQECNEMLGVLIEAQTEEEEIELKEIAMRLAALHFDICAWSDHLLAAPQHEGLALLVQAAITRER